MKEVPIWEKSNLTLEEAAAYSGIGINKLRTLTDNEHCQFVFRVVVISVVSFHIVMQKRALFRIYNTTNLSFSASYFDNILALK